MPTKDKNGIKWINDLEPSAPLTDAARHVLSVRFQTIAHDLPLAIEKSDSDVEHVHHLRVGTRRARAALDTFACCLKRRARKRARTWLRTIRKAAGEARDWDVFLLTLAELGTDRDQRHAPGLHFLAGYASAQRRHARKELLCLSEKHFLAPEKMVEQILSNLRRPKDRSLRNLRDLALPRLNDALERLQDSASQELAEYEPLHQVRIAGKRLRYAMEIFGSCFASAFHDDLYPVIEEMQDILGCANDSHVAIARLIAIKEQLASSKLHDRTKLKPGIEGVMRFHQRRLPRERRNFQAWWKRWQATGCEAAFHELLHDG